MFLPKNSLVCSFGVFLELHVGKGTTKWDIKAGQGRGQGLSLRGSVRKKVLGPERGKVTEPWMWALQRICKAASHAQPLADPIPQNAQGLTI